MVGASIGAVSERQPFWLAIGIVGVVTALALFLPGYAIRVSAAGIEAGRLFVRSDQIERIEFDRKGVFIVFLTESGAKKALHVAKRDGRFEIGATNLVTLLEALWPCSAEPGRKPAGGSSDLQPG